MVQHPMDFLRKHYIEPAGLTQDMLCKHLVLGKKTISELYQHKRGLTVSTAKKLGKLFDVSPQKLLEMQVSYDLENDLTEPDIKPLDLPANTKSLLTLLNANRSGDKYTTADLVKLFRDDQEFTNSKLLYALFTKAPLSKVVKYMADMRIGVSHLKHLYRLYVKEGGKPNLTYERLLADDDKTAIVKLCDNGHFFNDPREFEEYLFYRLRLLRHKKPLKDLAMDATQPQTVRQRALYLYSHASGTKPKLGFQPNPTTLFANSKRPTTDLKADKYGVLGSIDTARYNQFVATGSY
ncbi:HigA family addiction module antitoxin [Sulfurovum sp.]|uniref:HigA family addiction module antitoxin n=1 Tax=Sulfurovum sp. TaxID=1969726 RepID=UPI0035677B43